MAFSVAMGVTGINVVVDPYRVFDLLRWGTGYTDNERFNKIEYLLSHTADHNAFIVGSSRMGLYDPRWLNERRRDRRYYNLSVFGGSAGEAHRMLQSLAARGVQIESVFMGIDLFPFVTFEREVTPAYRQHPIVTGQSYERFYVGYLFSPSLIHCLLKVQQSASTVPDIQFDFATGRYFLRKWDREIANDPEGYKARTFGEPGSVLRTARTVAWNARAFAELKGFVTWLDAEGISRQFFIAPHHHSELGQFEPRTVPEFRARIKTIVGPIPDLSERANWSTNDAWYYEAKHYRPELARLIVKQVMGAPTSDTPLPP